MRWRRNVLAALGGALVAMLPAVASAHGRSFDSPAEAARTWSLDPLVLVPLALFTAVYLRGAARLLAAIPRGGRYGWRLFAYGAGVMSLVVALISPLDSLGAVYVTAHMAQHLVLMQVAAPLLVLGAPLIVAGVGSARIRRIAVALRRRDLSRIALVVAPLTVLALHGVALLAWHLPALYNLALASRAAHALQHAAFLGTAMLFWYAVLPSPGRRPGSYPASFGLVFVMAVVSGGLGALMTVAPAPWYDYPAYAGLAPLQDQQLAGAIMWVIGGTLYAATAVTVFVLWLRQGEARALASERREAVRDQTMAPGHEGGPA